MKAAIPSSETSELLTRRIALTAVFAALYVVLAALYVFPVIGGSGRGISAAVMIAPLIGLLLGPYMGALAVILGGVITAFLYPLGAFGPFSFLPHLAATFCAGLLAYKKQAVCIVIYLCALLTLAFFPVVGPIWLFPPVLWLDIIGLLVLASPLQYKAVEYLHAKASSAKLALAVGVTCFTSTLLGHVAGNIMWAAFNWPNAAAVQGTWVATTLVYPVERLLVTVVAVVVGTAMLKSLRAYGFRV